MKKTEDAIRYGIMALGISPEEMFNLIESSNEYTGEDYNRWLANEIIKIAEKDGVGYSQLLVKRFNIIQSILNNEDAVIKKDWLSIFCGEDTYSINFEEAGKQLEVDDWFNGVDLDLENSEFAEESLPDELVSALKNNDNISIFARLSSASSNKNSDLYLDAKSNGIDCYFEGSLLLYRICSLVETYDLTNIDFRFLVNTEFLSTLANDSLWKYFFGYFKCGGYVIPAKDLLEGTSSGVEYAYVICKPRLFENKMNNHITLNNCSMLDGVLRQEKGSKRYTSSSVRMIDYIKSLADKNTDLEEVSCVDSDGYIKDTVKEVPKNALGFLNYSFSKGLWLSALPCDECNESIPILRNNLLDCIVYFGVSESLQSNEEIKLPINGSKDYITLLSNCIPMFLYSNKNYIRGYRKDNALYESTLSVTSEFVKKLIEKYEVYYSVEAKELIEIANGYVQYLKVNSPDSEIISRCFNDLRMESEHKEFDSRYSYALLGLRDYIRGCYRNMNTFKKGK